MSLRAIGFQCSQHLSLEVSCALQLSKTPLESCRTIYVIDQVAMTIGLMFTLSCLGSFLLIFVPHNMVS